MNCQHEQRKGGDQNRRSSPYHITFTCDIAIGNSSQQKANRKPSSGLLSVFFPVFPCMDLRINKNRQRQDNECIYRLRDALKVPKPPAKPQSSPNSIENMSFLQRKRLF